MIFEPGLIQHPKYLVLRRAVGPGAMEYLFRLWRHCQMEKRGEEWGAVGWRYVEAVCGWEGEPRVLWNALRQPVVKGGVGFIKKEKNGKILINSWNEINASLVANWVRGPAGRRGNGSKSMEEPEAVGSPGVSGGLAGAKPGRSRGVSDRTGQDRIEVNIGTARAGLADEACAPGPGARRREIRMPGTEEEAEIWCQAIGVPKGYARTIWLQVSAVGFKDGSDRLIEDWPRYVKGRYEREFGEGVRQRVEQVARGMAAGKGEEPLWARIKRLEEAIAEHPANKKGRAPKVVAMRDADQVGDLVSKKTRLAELKRRAEGAGITTEAQRRGEGAGA